MAAACGVDDESARGQHRECRLVEDVPRIRCQRQKAGKDVAAREERWQRLFPRETLDPWNGLLRAAPAGDDKIEFTQALRRHGADLAETQHAYARIFRPARQESLAPIFVLLRRIEHALR